MVPTVVTQAVLADAEAAITAWATRHGWSVDLDRDALTLTVRTTHPKTGNSVIFHAALDGFPAIPPAWTCRDAAGNTPRSGYPAPGNAPGIPSSIFHPNPVICAHWNRLAYGIHGGPHADWGDLTQWKTAGPGTVRADTLPDMLAALRVHLAASPGMQT